PFLQGFHGYPSHFQNFTLTGHRRLFERAGLRILDSGVCVGPSVALTDLAFTYIRHIVPLPFVSRVAGAVFRLLAFPFRAIDLLLAHAPSSHLLASTTYVLASKRAG
ncbi:MAG TPA: hypothetical protein VKF32_10915, partial [Thermoanaerobaculia bacterium]|nr:hypothetical protein [Thermoanaerobaculia bacterium]